MNGARVVASIRDAVFTVAVAAIAISAVRNTFQTRVVAANAGVRDSAVVADWERLVTTGKLRGVPTASVRIVEFVDFECAACASYAPVLASVLREFPGDVAIIYQPLPLGYHRLARGAARAAECAAIQGEFWAMHDLLLAQQDSLGLKSWLDFAGEIQLDSTEFAACMKSRVERASLDSARAAADGFGARGTPTLVVNGWHLKGPLPTLEDWRRRIGSAARAR
jgi:protein-disulfide isomerase